MSYLKKMALRGIRSFDPNEEQTLEFLTPVTLILGQNGSGKTTIIESLKAMSCGSMPPNSESGKRFIHDPKIERAPETKASIKLIFDSTDQKEILAMRTFRLTHKGAKKLEFRKMDQILKFTGVDGNVRSVSSGCVDMDKQMCQLFGVSAAVLENVIFCHQDETLWPFSDQGHLKKIFDEIFETEKYTKVLTELRNQEKIYRAYKKSIKSDFDLKSKDYDVYQKLIKNASEQREKLKKIDEELARFNTEIENSNRRMAEISGKEQQLVEVEKELQVLKFHAGDLKNQFQKLASSAMFKEMGKTKEELVEMQEQITQNKGALEKKRLELARDSQALQFKGQKIDAQLLTLRNNKVTADEIAQQEAKLVLLKIYYYRSKNGMK